ncbi:hypothetical protein S23_27520 [Bradyrhizobium cosmicum]|uniref:Helix-turn-helix domain-containing protein n=1 Tax=Bradyrhizobium cosmicum TaxID=1404864 RepID=A0AAI8MCL6_9BRAD|nr:hypothetical protein S23_27520 [Bradyrhizobium cosmicum]
MSQPLARQRIKVADAVALLGLEARTIRDMAQRGEIPGAAKPRGVWTFDLALLEDYQRRCEETACQRAADLRPRPAVSGVVTSSTAASRSVARTSNGHYGQTIQKLRALAAARSATAR